MLKKPGRYKLFKTAANPIDGEMHELDFFVCSTLKNERLEWQLERAFCFDSGCNEEDQKLRYIFVYREFCLALLDLTANILASDRLYNAAWYNLMTDSCRVYTGILPIDDEDDIIFDEYCQDRWYVMQIYDALSLMEEQGSFLSEDFPEIKLWAGKLPPRQIERDLIFQHAGIEPLHYQPYSRVVEEEVFYPLDEQDDGDLPEVREDLAETVEIIKQAIDAQLLVEIEYCSRELEITTRLFAPEIIVIFNEQWYVAGFCKLREERRTFRLDNIIKIAATSQTEPGHGIAADVKEQGLFS